MREERERERGRERVERESEKNKKKKRKICCTREVRNTSEKSRKDER